MLTAIQPCDQRIRELTDSLQLRTPGASAGSTRSLADEADRACEAARAAFATMHTPTSLDEQGTAMLKQAGQKWAAAMAGRRRAVSLARDYLLKPDQATAQAYAKRLEAAQAQVADGVDLLKKAAAAIGVDLMR
jgi:hypothetical protein